MEPPSSSPKLPSAMTRSPSATPLRHFDQGRVLEAEGDFLPGGLAALGDKNILILQNGFLRNDQGVLVGMLTSMMISPKVPGRRT